VCGRFALSAGPEELARAFGVSIEDVTLPPRYNVAPTQTVPVVRAADAGRRLVPMCWGLARARAAEQGVLAAERYGGCVRWQLSGMPLAGPGLAAEAAHLRW
jgi:putative SOS response-associated peptidase YedK